MPKPTRLFISYARKDSEDFARRLHNDLQTLGFNVWWDKEAMEARGHTFQQVLRDAVAGSDRLILVVTPGSAESEYVQWEWQHALKYCMTINPVVRLKDYSIIPEPLKNLHAFDLRDGDKFADEFNRLVEELREPAVIPGHIHHVPPLPPHHLARPDDHATLTNFVLADVHSDTPTIISSVASAKDVVKGTTAVQGMGGIGKSVIAVAFARDCQTRRAFTDGVFWLPVGQNPSVRELCRTVGVGLGDNQKKYEDERDAQSNLQTLLADNCCLLVLDDVWDAKVVEPFHAIITGTRCRLLVTTRSTQIAGQIGANEHRVQLLSAEQAHTFLREWAGKDDPELPALADKLGNLPLALKLAGAQLADGLTGAEYLEIFQRVSEMTLELGATGRDENLETCFNLSVERLPEQFRPLYHSLGIFPEDVWIPEHVVVRLWTHLGASSGHAKRLILDLGRLALIERDVENHAVQLHDLLHDYNRENLGDGYVATQEALLAAYNPAGQPWYEVEHDGYLYFHLA